MTENEAIKLIENDLKLHSKDLSSKYKNGLRMAIQALEKQIPKKPIFDFNSSDVLSKFHCPCGNIIKVHHDIGTMDNNDAPNYCSNCGLKFDWNEYV